VQTHQKTQAAPASARGRMVSKKTAPMQCSLKATALKLTKAAPASARGRMVSKKTAPIVSSKCTAMSGLGAGSVIK